MACQCTYYKNKHKRLSVNRINCLQSAGFVWNPMRTSMFKKYLAFKEENNTSSIPKKADPSLSNWMSFQRSCYKRKHKRSLSVDRINPLQSSGFVWDLKQNKIQQKKFSIDPLNPLKFELDDGVVVAGDATKNLQNTAL